MAECFSGFHWRIGCGFEVVFIPPTRGGLRRHTYKPLQGKSHRRRRVPGLNQVWTEVFLSTTPIKIHHFYLLPSSLFDLYGFLRPVFSIINKNDRLQEDDKI